MVQQIKLKLKSSLSSLRRNFFNKKTLRKYYRQIIDADKDTKYLLSLWAGIIVIVLVLVYLVFATVFTTESKYLSIANFYPFEVKVKLLEKSYDIKEYDIFTHEFKVNDNFDIEVFDQNDKLLTTINIKPITYKAQLILAVLSQENDYCYFKANVEPLYYPHSEEAANLTDLMILSELPATHVIYPINIEKTIYIYPGSAEVEDLPKTLTSSNLIGIYPIKCTYLHNNKHYVDTVKFFESYDGEEQREYYKNEKKRILETTNSKEL